jgi:outer membrane receptor protein involved in Fe transport
MFTNSKLAKSIKLACAFGAVTTALSLQAVNAQETTDEEAEVTERIQVTGSRIKRVDLESVSPVTVITIEDIELSGDTTLAEVMRNSSINTFGSFRGQSGYGSGAAATSEVNLRGLGAGATLVLIDGRRLPGVGYDGGSTQDLSMIPMAIVERVEILRDGASAVYGSDAVAGVINIITKKEFDGIEASYFFEDPGVDGGNTIRYNFSGGATGEKGSIVFIAEHENRQEVADSSVTGMFPDYGYSAYSPVAMFSGDSGLQYNEEFCGDEVADTSNEASRCAYYYSNTTWLYGASDKDSIMTKMDYELTDDVILKARFSAVNTSTHTRYAATPVSTTPITMDADNAMNPFGEDGLIYYRTATKGYRDSYTDKTNYEAVFGLEGSLMDQYDWQLYYQYTDGKEVATTQNLVNDSTFQDLIDDESLDLFNVQGLSYDDWIDYNDDVLSSAMHTGLYQVKQKRTIIDGNIGGEVFANDDVSVSVVVGFEYSDLDFTQTSDPESGLGIISGGSGGDDVFANRTRDSYYIETAIMLPANVEISAALRYDGYDISGDTGDQMESSDFSDTVPKIGISWRPTEDLLVRASWGEAFRAPTMSEMFASRSFSFPDGLDTYYCDTLGNPDGDTAYCTTSQQHLTWTGGNPELQPENSESLTLGVVWNVTDDLSVEFGYYSYEYTDKISSVTASQLLELDTDGNNANVVRLDNNKVDYIISGYANLDTYETNGFDLTVDYGVETEVGDFGVNLELSKVQEFKISTPGEGSFDYIDYVSSEPRAYPGMRGNLSTSWRKDDLTVAWRVLYIGKADEPAYPDYGQLGAPSYFKHNVQVGYNLTDTVKFNVGIKNLFDKYWQSWPGEWRGYDSYNYDPLGRTYTATITASF